ncbi:MAG: recombinase family protein [Fischerella sp. CENA71]|nr:recombinase family protein [Fischerella sp. CENA71]
MARLIGYGRCSTTEQQYTRQVQEEKIKDYCKLYNHELIGFYYDHGVSGSKIDRPELNRALLELTSGEAEGMIVYKLDRLTRNLGDLSELMTSYFSDKYSLVSVCDQLDTKTPSGRLVINILGSVAQWELETIRDRVKSALVVAKASGKHLGKVPYGHKLINGYLAESVEEIHTIDTMRQLRNEKMSYQAIARHLNDAGMLNRGKQWYASSIHDVLNRVPIL